MVFIQRVFHLILTAAVSAVARLEKDGTAQTKTTAVLVRKCIRQLCLQFLGTNNTVAARYMYLVALAEMSLISRSFPAEVHLETQVGKLAGLLRDLFASFALMSNMTANVCIFCSYVNDSQNESCVA